MATDSTIAQDSRLRVDASWLEAAIRAVFVAAGVSAEGSDRIAKSLTLADMSGVSSHGSLLVPMYIGRLRAGSISRAELGEVVVDHGAMAVIDAGNSFGHLTGAQAMGLAADKAAASGIGMVAVRRAFHFGRASDYARIATERGQIGIAMANTRPLMPAIGGAETVIGNNPLAIGVPTRGRPVMLDMATSEAALGKIRLAQAAGRDIPPTWATDAAGEPTTDPTAAIAGMLLPTGGAKGFGLAFMIDVLTGVLSGGASGSGVQGLYADLGVPNDCAHAFIAIDPTRFGDREGFLDRMDAFTQTIVTSRRRAGVDAIKLPGQVEDEAVDRAAADGILLDTAVIDQLRASAELVGAELPELALVAEAAQA